MAVGDNGQPLYTCLSCNIAFPNAHDQRDHFRSDWHRYNAKRRVAQLPPIRLDVFHQKVAAAAPASASASSSSSSAAAAASQSNTAPAQDGAAPATQAVASRCAVCSKSFASPMVLKDHLASKKHKDQALQASLKQAQQIHNEDTATAPTTTSVPATSSSSAPAPASASASASAPTSESTRPTPMTLSVPDNATEDEINALIDAKLASATRIDPTRSCLFCPTHISTPPSLETTLEHMRRAHSFFLPEQDYLVDLPGLMTYLADKITVGNICLYCNGRGRSFASLEAVRGHMLDKGHCKIAYVEEEDCMELSDFYDFSSSYPADEDEEWEDDADAGAEEEEEEEEEEEDVQMDEGTGGKESTTTRPARASKKANTAHFGDTEYELVLPSGIRLGHRALKRYYAQTTWTTPATLAQETELARRNQRLIAAADAGLNPKEAALLVKGRGGRENNVVAKSRGQAREARRYVNEFRDVRVREAYKTRVAYTNNNQKHFRDPLLQ
ncbi:unnamed protein product [Tilletia caries]|nr:unnamed protein product [Tilletia caries]